MGDEQRLNWLEREIIDNHVVHFDYRLNSIENDLRMHGKTDKQLVSCFTASSQYVQGRNIREAIDKAMTGEKGGLWEEKKQA